MATIRFGVTLGFALAIGLGIGSLVWKGALTALVAGLP